MEGGTYSGRHVQWAGGPRHVLGRRQVGEWRGWAGRHAVGLCLRPAAGAGTVRHMTGREEDGERRWGRSAHGVAWVHAIGGVMVARGGGREVGSRWANREGGGTVGVWVSGLGSTYLERGCK